MFTIHATRKLLDRVNRPVLPPVSEPATILGNWYANVLFWKPQVVLLVNERTLLPVLMPLAPAATLGERFPEALQRVLEALGVVPAFVEVEISAMADVRFARTANRSVVGVMNGFKHLAEDYRDYRGLDDLVTLAVELSGTPCGPLYSRHVSPDRELDAASGRMVRDRTGQQRSSHLTELFPDAMTAGLGFTTGRRPSRLG